MGNQCSNNQCSICTVLNCNSSRLVITNIRSTFFLEKKNWCVCARAEGETTAFPHSANMSELYLFYFTTQNISGGKCLFKLLNAALCYFQFQLDLEWKYFKYKELLHVITSPTSSCSGLLVVYSLYHAHVYL